MKNYWIEQEYKDELERLVKSMLQMMLEEGSMDMPVIMKFINEYIDNNNMNHYKVNVKIEDGDIQVYIY